MNFFQTLTMAFKSIMSNKVRSILTMIGIIIGVASVLTLVSFIDGSNQEFLSQLSEFGTSKIELNYYGKREKVLEESIRFVTEDLADNVSGIAPYTTKYMGDGVKYKNKTLSVRVIASNEEYDIASNNNIEEGRALNAFDVEKGINVAVIGSAVKNNIFGIGSALGQNILINGQNFEIVGVYKEKFDAKQPDGPDSFILVPLSKQRLLFGTDKVEGYYINANEGEDLDGLVKAISENHNNKFPGNTDLIVYSDSSFVAEMEKNVLLSSLITGGVAGISLLVGGIGIMNIMLVTVTERTREIGIRMAIGAKRSNIIMQFLIEAASVSSFGGVIGIILGIMGAMLLSSLVMGKLYFPSTQLIVGAFTFSAALGIIFGIYPANKASKLQPVDALRTQ